jgi:hypothetical protein
MNINGTADIGAIRAGLFSHCEEPISIPPQDESVILNNWMHARTLKWLGEYCLTMNPIKYSVSDFVSYFPNTTVLQRRSAQLFQVVVSANPISMVIFGIEHFWLDVLGV